jgi:hypothetical protein
MHPIYNLTGKYWTFSIESSSSIFFAIKLPKILTPVENKTYDTSNVPLNLIIEAAVSGVRYSLDGQKNVTIAGNTTLTGLPNGDHNVTVYAMDETGNIGASETIYFRVEVPFPTALAVAPIASVAVIGVGFAVYFVKFKKRADKL